MILGTSDDITIARAIISSFILIPITYSIAKKTLIWATNNFKILEESDAGPLICVSCSKLVLFAAGHHVCLIHLGLEANIIKIVWEDFPGSDPTRGHRDIGRFHILQEFNFF